MRRPAGRVCTGAHAAVWRCASERSDARPSATVILRTQMSAPVSPGTLVLLIVVLLMLIGMIRIWSHDRNDVNGSRGGLGLAVFALPVLLLTGQL